MNNPFSKLSRGRYLVTYQGRSFRFDVKRKAVFNFFGNPLTADILLSEEAAKTIRHAGY